MAEGWQDVSGVRHSCHFSRVPRGRRLEVDRATAARDVEEAVVFVVECPQVGTSGGRRLVSENRIRGLAAAASGWEMTVACPCGQVHVVQVAREVRRGALVG